MVGGARTMGKGMMMWEGLVKVYSLGAPSASDEVGGIVVTHGGTPTTRLSFARVLRTIKVQSHSSCPSP